MKKSILYIFLLTLFISCKKNDSITQQKVDKANGIANQFLIDQQIPGMAISVSQNGKTIWSKGFGYSDVAAKKEVIPQTTQFRIASISKTLTAFALAKLADDKKLNFEASLNTYIPDYPKKKYDFTIRQIGGHVAGIRHYKGNEFLLNRKMTIVEGLDIFKNDSLLFEPGTNYQYSTYGWNLLSVVIQNAANEDYNEYMQKVIFSPLKMKNTSLGYSDKEMPNRTLFYSKQNGEVKIAPTVSNEFKAAGGGFVSTSEDLILFGNEFINPKTISKTSIAELLKTQTTTKGKKTNYGIGIGVANVKNNTLRYSHSGGGVGATTYLLMYPEKDLVISILTNLSGVNIQKLVGELEAIFIE